jgi:glycosyltransferase involved in cell wall biosynthesis
VLLVHGVEVWRRPTWLRRISVRSCVTLIAAVSRFTAGRMARGYGLPESRFLHLPNAVDLEPGGGGLPKRAPSREPGFRLLTVSRLSLMDTYKNVDKVIRAMPAILAKHPETIYSIVGDGPWKPALQSLRDELGLQERVRFEGGVDDAARDALYGASDLFVLPSTGEGFGIVFLEAWRHGVPVIASDQDAASELIRQGEDGYCVSPEPKAIASAILEIMADAGRARRMGEAGRRRLEAGYTHAHFRARLRSVLGVDARCAA